MKLPFLLSSILISATVASAAPTEISGIARNGSSQNKPVAGALVQLVRPRKDATPVLVGTTRTNASGVFRFPARQYSKDDLLFVHTSHQGFEYSAIAFDGGQKLKAVNINVDPSHIQLKTFDATNKLGAAKLGFQVHHLAITSTPTGLHCIERIVVENPSNLTFVGAGERKISVLLNVPKSAQNVKLDPKITGAQLLQTKDGWGVSMPIMPNAFLAGMPFNSSNAVIFSYDVAWPSSLPWAKNVDLSRETIYPTKFFFVARETGDKELQVSAPKLGAEAPQELPVDGKMETRLVNAIGSPMQPMASVTAGQALQIAVSRPVSALFWGFAGLVGALCLFLPLALLKPKRAERRGKESVSSHTSTRSVENTGFAPLNGFAVTSTLTPTGRELVQKIADLDDAFEAKQLDEAAYQNQRAAWKKQLIDSLAHAPDEHAGPSASE